MIAPTTSRIGTAARRNAARACRSAKSSAGRRRRRVRRRSSAASTTSSTSSRRSSIDVGDVEVAVDDDVEERPEQEALARSARARCAGARSGAAPRRPGTAGIAVLAAVAHRESQPGADHDVDLAAVASRRRRARSRGPRRGSSRRSGSASCAGRRCAMASTTNASMPSVVERAGRSRRRCGSSASIQTSPVAGIDRGPRRRRAAISFRVGRRRDVAPRPDHGAEPTLARRAGTIAGVADPAGDPMAIDTAELTAEELRAQTTRVAARAPARGLDGGGRRRRHATRGAGCAPASTTRSGASRSARPGYATPTWPAEYGAGLSLSPGRGQARQRGARTTTRCRARSTSSASAWAARRSSRGAPRR